MNMLLQLHFPKVSFSSKISRRTFSAWINRYNGDQLSIPPKTSDPPILYASLPDNQGKVAYCLHHTSVSSSATSATSISSVVPSPTASSSSSPLVIAIHGAPGSTFDWRYLGTILEPHVKLLRFAVPGHAETSESTVKTPSAKHIAETLWKTIDIISTLPQHLPLNGRNNQLSNSSSGTANVVVSSNEMNSSSSSSSTTTTTSASPVTKFHHPVYLLSHSLGHEVITAMVHERPDLIKGIICISPVGIRPHAAIRPWNFVRLIGFLSYRQGIVRALIDRYLYIIYVYAFGFPKRISYLESGWCAQRVAFRNFTEMQNNIREIVQLGIPVLL